MTVTHYYAARKIRGQWYAFVYHYDGSGNIEISDYLSCSPSGSKASAEDDACKWADDNGIDATCE